MKDRKRSADGVLVRSFVRPCFCEVFLLKERRGYQWSVTVVKRFGKIMMEDGAGRSRRDRSHLFYDLLKGEMVGSDATYGSMPLRRLKRARNETKTRCA